jgi:hypothetical protein
MTLRRVGAAALYFCLLSGLAFPQTPVLDPTLIRQRMEEAKVRQREGGDLPLLDISRVVPNSTAAGKTRSRHFSKPGTGPLSSEARPGLPVNIVTHVTSHVRPPAFPTQNSDAVIRGFILAARAQLTEDQTGLYSEFDIRVDEVLKPAAAVAVGTTVTGLRWGGALQVPSGLIRIRNAVETMPVVGSSYVLFLKHYTDTDPAFLIVTGYRLDGARVSALDILPEPMRFEGDAEAAFVERVRAELP